MVALDPTTKVLIIGAGLSGVALAQILRKEKLKFEIFERDDGSRSQGWTIGLDECLVPLYQLLPDDVDDLATSSPNFALQKVDTFTVVDGPSHQVLGTTTTKSMGEAIPSVFANRNKFREMLKVKVDVQYSKQFASFQEDRDGVTVFFKDGTSARGDVLVGADGSKSPVRTQLLRGFKATPSLYLMFHGTVTLSKRQYEPLLQHSTNGILAGGPGLKSYVLLMEYLDEDTALFNWTVAWRSENLESDYAHWQTASQEAMLERSVELIQHYPPDLVKAISQSQAKDVYRPPLRLLETVLPPQGLPKGRVTLIGDAAHSMIPFRGMGANTAILDSCDLGKGLIDGSRAKEDLQWVLQCYEDKMIPRGRKKVLESRATGDSANTGEIAGGRLL